MNTELNESYIMQITELKLLQAGMNILKMLVSLIFALALRAFHVGSCLGHLNFSELSTWGNGLCSAIITRQGYPCNEYSVTTEDGYVLSVQRIPHGRNAERSEVIRPPVFLQHGLLQGGDDWVLNTPSESLAFLLADASFDVWIGNNRGSKWSSGHASASPSPLTYWNFSWDELATYDLPAMLGLVRHATGQKVHYVGHSQGTLILLAALSQNSLLDIIQSAALLSPIAYLEHTTSKLLNALTKFDIDKVYSSSTGEQEFDVRNPLNSDLISLICSTSGSVDCSDILTAFTGPNCCVNSSRAAYYMQFEPQSTSIKNLVHLSQMIKSGNLSKYDYGEEENKRRYGQSYPPAYDLKKVGRYLRMVLAYGGKDYLSDRIDVEHLVRDLSSLPQLLEIPQYGHTDFILAIDANTNIYQHLIAFFRKNS